MVGEGRGGGGGAVTGRGQDFSFLGLKHMLQKVLCALGVNFDCISVLCKWDALSQMEKVSRF